MELLEIVNKLIGSIHPVGETHIDNIRFENLKVQCDLVEALLVQINKICHECKDMPEFSIKKSQEYADNFLTNRLGIPV